MCIIAMMSILNLPQLSCIPVYCNTPNPLFKQKKKDKKMQSFDSGKLHTHTQLPVQFAIALTVDDLTCDSHGNTLSENKSRALELLSILFNMLI